MNLFILQLRCLKRKQKEVADLSQKQATLQRELKEAKDRLGIPQSKWNYDRKLLIFYLKLFCSRQLVADKENVLYCTAYNQIYIVHNSLLILFHL